MYGKGIWMMSIYSRFFVIFAAIATIAEIATFYIVKNGGATQTTASYTFVIIVAVVVILMANLAYWLPKYYSRNTPKKSRSR